MPSFPSSEDIWRFPGDDLSDQREEEGGEGDAPFSIERRFRISPSFILAQCIRESVVGVTKHPCLLDTVLEKRSAMIYRVPRDSESQGRLVRVLPLWSRLRDVILDSRCPGESTLDN